MEITDTHIAFAYKDYRQAAKPKIMRLSKAEFVRRYAMHILPTGFRRIRHYGFLCSRFKALKLAKARKSLGMKPLVHEPKKSWQQLCEERLNFSPNACRHCGEKALVIIETLLPKRAPPTVIQLLALTGNI